MDYEYLLGMKLWALTLEKKNELLKKKDEKFQEYEVLKKKSPSDLWNEDLDAFVAKVRNLHIAVGCHLYSRFAKYFVKLLLSSL